MTPNEIADALEQYGRLRSKDAKYTLLQGHGLDKVIAAAIAHLRAPAALPELPPLPSPDEQWVDGKDEYGYDTYSHAYTADQMRAYALAALAGREQDAAWMIHARRLTEWKYCMSYNDSYFGEPAGLVKQVAMELDRLMPSAAIAASAGKEGA